MRHTLGEVAQAVQARLIGERTIEVSGVASIRSAKPSDLVFVEDEKNLPSAQSSQAAAIIAGEFAIRSECQKALLICSQPKLAFARAARLLMEDGRHEPGIDPTAAVHPTARVGNGACLERNVVIAEEAVIEEGTWIGANSVVGAAVRVGQGCLVYPNVTIYPGTKLGNRVIVHAGSVLGSDGFGYVREAHTGRYEKFPQIGRLEIGDDVEIGANATVDRGALDVTYIARGTKIDNLVHVGHNVQIGEDVVIAAQTGLSGSAVVESNVIIGGQVGIADHVRIENGAILGAQSGIPTKKVIRGKGVVFWGTPARPIHEYLKELAVLAKLAKKTKSRSDKPGNDD